MMIKKYIFNKKIHMTYIQSTKISVLYMEAYTKYIYIYIDILATKPLIINNTKEIA